MHGILLFIKRLTSLCLQSLRHHFIDWTKSDTATSLLVGALTDLARSKSKLVAENAPLRQQLIKLRRQVKRPACAKADRMLLVFLASMVRTWKHALFIVQPETLLRWHHRGFRLYWKYTSRAAPPTPKISPETVALIKEIARDNRLWGAERIRGALLELGLRVCTRTIQKYMRQVRPARPRGLNWKPFLHTYAEQIWECDSLPVTDFFVIELHARRVIHVDVHTTPRCPTDAWTAQRLREATAYGVGSKYLIRDNDDKLWMDFARVAHTSRIEMLTLHDGAAHSAPVFRSRGGASGKVGRKLDPSQVTRIVEAAACRAGIAVYIETVIVEGKQVRRKLSRVSPHWLRHAHASHALDNGASIAV